MRTTPRDESLKRARRRADIKQRTLNIGVTSDLLRAIERDFADDAKDANGGIAVVDGLVETNGQRTIRLLRETKPLDYLRITSALRLSEVEAQKGQIVEADIDQMLIDLDARDELERTRYKAAKEAIPTLPG